MTRLIAPLAAAALLLSAPFASAEGDVAKGEKIFRKCAACHTITADGPKKPGPNLHNIVGRKVGSLEGFAYSDAMKAGGEAGDTWTDAHLKEFLADPKALYKGHKMTFPGLKKEAEQNDVVAYLRANSPDAPAE